MCDSASAERKASGFNTDDGIRRAAMTRRLRTPTRRLSFNTDDGIRRAAISFSENSMLIKSKFQYR